MSVKSGQGNTATIHTVVVTTRVEVTVVKVNPETSQSVCVGQLHTNAPVTGDCPFNKCSLLCAEKKGHSKSAEHVYRFTSDSDEQVSDADMYNIGSSDGASSDSCTSDESVVAVCTCGAERRAHKRGCPLSSRRGRTLFSPPSSSMVSALPRALVRICPRR